MSTKGVWYPDRSKATERDPPLYLHLSASSREVLQDAIEKVNDLISMDLGPLVEDKKDRMREKVNSDHLYVALGFLTSSSGNGQKKSYQSGWKRFETLMFVPRLSAHR